MAAYKRGLWIALLISVSHLKVYTAENHEFSDEHATKDKVCLTPECVRAAALLLENLDPRADPCDDFYQYSCGGFLQRHLAGRSYVHVDTLLDERIKAQLRKLLFQPKYPNEPKSVHKMKDFFLSCVDEDRIRTVGIEPLKSYLDDHGGWPVVTGDEWNEDAFKWQDATSRLIRENNREASLTAITYTPNYRFSHISERFLLKVSTPYSTLQSSLGMNSTYIRAHFNFMVGIATSLGATKERAEEEFREVLEVLEQYATVASTKSNSTSCPCTDDCEIRSCTPPSTTENDGFLANNITDDSPPNTQRLITVAHLYNITDQVDWLQYLKKTFSSEIAMETKVIFDIDEPAIWKNLIEFIETIPKRVIANYLMWMGINRFIDRIEDPSISRLEDILNKEIQRNPQRELRWTKCLTDTNLFFNHALTWLYSSKYFTAGEKEGVTDMFNRIRTEFRQTLDAVDWLTEETLENAKSKLSKLMANIAYPQELLDSDLLDRHYASLEIDSKNYFENTLHSMKFNFDKDTAMIGKNITRTHWSYMESILYTNAFYYHSINTIAIPATQVRGIYYAKNRLMALNFGSLGSIVGHEIMHAFNEIAEEDSYNPKVRWWKPEDSKAFANRSECIIQQYGKFGHPKTGQINGTQTLDENIADNSGLRYAYQAYQRWMKENGDEPQLPGMNGFSQNQIFWLAFANSWCRAEHQPLHVQIDRYLRHSLPKFRVLGAVANLEEFSNDFQCPLGSPLNPVTKCTVW